MNDMEATLQMTWQSFLAWLDHADVKALAMAADVVLTLAVLAAVGLVYSRLLHRQRRLEVAATQAQTELVDRLEKVTERLELRLSEAAEKLNRDIAAIGEDAREARRIGRSLPGQLERIQAGLSAAQDEILHQSVAKYQANEAIKNALTGKPKQVSEGKQPAKSGAIKSGAIKSGD